MLLTVLAFYIAFIPHQNYIYPIHIDEWVHLAYSNAVLNAGSIQFNEPFSGQYAIGMGADLEIGFHLFLGIFQRISGIQWIDIYRFFPSIIFVIAVLSVYILARRLGFGWDATGVVGRGSIPSRLVPRVLDHRPPARRCAPARCAAAVRCHPGRPFAPPARPGRDSRP